MSETGKDAMKRATSVEETRNPPRVSPAVEPGTDARPALPAAVEAVRWRRVAAIAAGLVLVPACGGRAVDVAEDEAEPMGEAGARALRPSPSRPAGGASPARQSPQPNPPPRAGEVCYSPSRIADSPGLQAVLPFLPEDALDDNDCLASSYSNWLDGGGCNYDPRPAVVRGERCCYLLDGTMSGCNR
jgi:hypothetical protein